MCRVIVVLLLSFYSFQQYGEGTRFLPMVVWDHINPLLKCHSNWMRIPNIDVYDRMDFMCPSPKVAVTLLDGYSRPTSEMNENIFMRKWHQRSDKTDKALLKEMLVNGSLCNPQDSVKLHTCRDGKEGKSLTVSFSPDRDDSNKNYVRNDLVVLFNNGDNGKASTLSDTSSRCTMVFIANITWLVGKIHDVSYGKCLNPDADFCGKINATECKKKEQSATSTEQPRTTSQPTSIQLTKTTKSNVTPAKTGAQTSSSKNYEYIAYGFIAGIAVTSIVVICTVIACKKRKRKQKSTMRQCPNNVACTATENQAYAQTPTTNGNLYGFNQTNGGNNNAAFRYSAVEPPFNNTQQIPNNLPPPDYQEATKAIEMDV